MSNEQITVVICVPVKDAPPNYLAEAYAREGSRFIRVPCPDCGQAMYLGTRQAKVVKAGAARMLCALCCAKLIERSDVEAVYQIHLSAILPPPTDA